MGCCLGEDANLAAAPLAQSLFFRPGERRPPMGRRRYTMAVEALVPPDATRVATHGAAHSATVYTNGKKLCREAILADLCTLLRPHDLLARSSRRNSVHKCPKTAPRGRFRQSVYTPASPRLSPTACSHDPYVTTVYTNGPKQLQEATLANLCTLLCPRGQADPAGSAWTPTRTTDSCVQGRTAPVWERSPG